MTLPNDSTIVPAGADIIVQMVDPAHAKAMNALITGKAPYGVIKQYSGKGGKVFSYIPHTDATKTMLDGFGQMWDWRVTSHDVLDDSAIAYGELKLYYYDQTGRLVHTRTIQEVGAREFITNKEGKIVQPKAFAVLGAASRALLRCMMRAFGYGLELYREEEQEFTVEGALKILEDYAKTRQLKKENRDLWTNAMKDAGITRENLIDRFQDAYKIVYEVAQKFQEERREAAEKAAREKQQKQAEAKNQQALKEKIASSKAQQPVQ